MRSEGLRLDLSFFPLRGYVPMNSKNSKLLCFPLIFSKDYRCQMISRSKCIALSTFYGCALMHKVQPLKVSSADRNHLSPWNTQSRWVSVFLPLEESRFLIFLWKSDWCARYSEVASFRLLDEAWVDWPRILTQNPLNASVMNSVFGSWDTSFVCEARVWGSWLKEF